MSGFPQSLHSRWAAGDTTIGAWLTYIEPLLGYEIFAAQTALKNDGKIASAAIADR